jgi:hypothetical protein
MTNARMSLTPIDPNGIRVSECSSRQCSPLSPVPGTCAELAGSVGFGEAKQYASVAEAFELEVAGGFEFEARAGEHVLGGS